MKKHLELKRVFGILLLCLFALSFQSCTKQIFKSKELSLYDLKGNVKSMTYKGQNYFFWTSVDRRINFDQEGHWVKFPGEIYEKSDKKIDFSSSDLDDGRIECIFDDAGRVVHVEYFSPDGPEIYDYHYDKNGFWSKIKTYYTAYEGEGKGETKTKEYTIDEVDDHGNWIKMHDNDDMVISRTISYYEDIDEGNKPNTNKGGFFSNLFSNKETKFKNSLNNTMYYYTVYRKVLNGGYLVGTVEGSENDYSEKESKHLAIIFYPFEDDKNEGTVALVSFSMGFEQYTRYNDHYNYRIEGDQIELFNGKEASHGAFGFDNGHRYRNAQDRRLRIEERDGVIVLTELRNEEKRVYKPKSSEGFPIEEMIKY